MTARRWRWTLLVVAVVSVLAAVAAAIGIGGRGSGDGAGVSRRLPPSSTTTDPVCDPAAVVASWPLERRVAQLLMIGVDPTNGASASRLVTERGVGGIFVGGDATGIFTDGTLTGLASAPIPPLVAVDEEGGRVQRIDALAGRIPSARRMAATMTPEQVYALALERGRALAGLGVTVDFAPVVDVSDQSDGEVIGDRAFGAEPSAVIAYAAAFARGLRDAGVVPVLKHFPGHGRAVGDSHETTAVTPGIETLRAVDLVPYPPLLAERPIGVMVGHLTVPGLTAPGEPASVSPATVALLRSELGYDGFVVTDDLSGMAAITGLFDTRDATVRAVAAGVDMALLVGGADEVPELLAALVDAVGTGRLDEAAVITSVQRVLALKGVDPCTVRP